MLNKLGLQLNNNKIHVITRSSCQHVTGIVVNEKAQVNSKYRKEIKKEIYYIKKFGLISHLNKTENPLTPKSYIDSLYGRILYVLQINDNDSEFKEYKQYILNLKKTI